MGTCPWVWGSNLGYDIGSVNKQNLALIHCIHWSTIFYDAFYHLPFSSVVCTLPCSLVDVIHQLSSRLPWYQAVHTAIQHSQCKLPCTSTCHMPKVLWLQLKTDRKRVSRLRPKTKTKLCIFSKTLKNKWLLLIQNPYHIMVSRSHQSHRITVVIYFTVRQLVTVIKQSNVISHKRRYI